MTEAVRKTRQAVLLWTVAVGVLLMVWAPALRLPQLWVLIGLSVLANVLQPAYALAEGTENREDRGTFVQIIGTVYATLVAALFELVVKRPAGLPFGAVSWVALGVMVAGLGLRTWAVRVLGGFFTLKIQVQSDQRIIQHGPYRLIRHPSYAGAWLTFVASCALLHSWVAAGLAAIALAAAFVRRIRYEERLLTQAFPEYADYAFRTGALIPRVRRARRGMPPYSRTMPEPGWGTLPQSAEPSPTHASRIRDANVANRVVFRTPARGRSVAPGRCQVREPSSMAP